jgi:AAA domain
MSLLPVVPAHALSAIAEERRWLIEELWSDQAVGIIGGEPKCCKSFLALDLAVSVASGTPCLRRFRAAQTGRVVLFAAEDAPHVVRARLEGICYAAGVTLSALDIQVITVPSLRLDDLDEQRRLAETIKALRPKLLVLDPFVRLHLIDENQSAEVAPLLGYLRSLQRRFGLSIAVVHHARKGAANVRAGQALRGSSEFHAWGDSNLYLRRVGEQLTLGIEHRAAPSVSGLALRLCAEGPRLALEILQGAASPDAPPRSLSPAQKVEQALAEAAQPLSMPLLRQACRIRTAHLCEALAALTAQGRVRKTAAGYQLATDPSFPFPDSL